MWCKPQCADKCLITSSLRWKKIPLLVFVVRWILPPSDEIKSDQSLSRVRLFATPWIAARQASLSITNSRSSLRLTSIESVMPSNHLILCRPLLLLASIFPSIRVFSNESVLHIRWPKYWNFSFSISPCNEYSELISFRIDWLDFLTVQGTLKSLLQTIAIACSNIMKMWLKVPILEVISELLTSNRILFLSNAYKNIYNKLRIGEKESDQISCSVVSHSLRPHELQHARPPCPLPTPGVHWDSRPSSQWCHPAISSSVVPFSCPQSLPASESFPVSQLFAWGGQSTGVSA